MHDVLLRLFPSLARRVAFAVILGSLVAWSIFVFFARQTGYEILDKQAEIKARGIAHLVTGIVEHVAGRGTQAEMAEVFRLAMATSDVVDAFVIGADGAILWHAHPGDSLKARPFNDFRDLKDVATEQYVTFRERDSVFAYIAEPFQFGQPESGGPGRAMPERGFLAMKISINDVRSTAIDHRTTNIVVSIAIFVVLAVSLYFLLALLVLRPIRILQGHIGKVAATVSQTPGAEKTSLPYFPVPGSRDEIDELYRGLNQLIERINSATARLTELHQEQLEHADRLAATGEMAAGMAHEIKNPIAGVLGALQVFHGEEGNDPARKEIIGEMMNQLERVTHAVNDLLQYARPTPPHLEPMELHPLIDRTVAILARQFRTSGVEIIKHYSPTDIRFPADRKQFQQAIWNLLLNALQATDSGGRITITTASLGHEISIMIADTGKGIAEEDLAKIFKPFYTTKHKGTGLGMTITKRIVEQHGGTLAVASAKGKGTTVTIVIPHAGEGAR